MIANKRIAALTALVMAVSLLFCGGIVYAAEMLDTTQIPEYQTRLFSGDVMTIDVQVAEEDWQSLLDNPTAKEWISGDLLINGERFSTVGVRTKGNSSLTQTANSEDARYSLQFKFDEYVKGQNCYGLDAFCVNNMMGDATYMKDYIAYDMMRYIGVEAPLTGYASVTVNGEAYCFGIALERYDESYLDRAFHTSGGQLYSVKIQMGGRGDFEDARIDTAAANAVMPDMGAMPDGDAGEWGGPNGRQGIPENDGARGGGMGGGFGGQSGGGSLVYTDDEISSYSAIFDNPVFSGNSDKDKERVITAIKNLNEGTNLEEYFDVDGILRYFAAHNFVVNLDSYSSNMQQNYYIYERGGRLTVLPWDYGLAFGGFQSGDASGVVNFPVDTPVSGVSMEDRPLLNKLLEVDEYREQYHTYLNQIAEGYVESGLFESTVAALNSKISAYVENDVSAYVTHEEYQAAVPELIEIGTLRAESVKGQLEGTVPSTASGQNENPSALVDSSGINLSALGSMMGGGNRDGGDFPGRGGQPDEEGGGFGNGFGGLGGGVPDRETIRQAMQILQGAGGELTDEVKAAIVELGISEEQIEMFSGMTGFPGRGLTGNPGTEEGDGAAPWGMQETAGAAEQSGFDPEYAAIVGILTAALAAATIFIAKKRKNVI
ncbi:MAG: CotH kinase family protein [Oscillospiraceae bacterium]|nr:CotH kinase family protein [Oscillospiraceae bacterium]